MQVALAAGLSLNMIVLPFPQTLAKLRATCHAACQALVSLETCIHRFRSSPYNSDTVAGLFRLNWASASSVSYYPALFFLFLAFLSLFRFFPTPTEDFSASDPNDEEKLRCGVRWGGGRDESGAEGTG